VALEVKREIVVDATGQVMGRLASIIAKLLLLGYKVHVVNVEKAVLSGDPHMVSTDGSAAYALVLLDTSIDEALDRYSELRRLLQPERLELLVTGGIAIFATINHAANARTVGMQMQPSIAIVFGKPKMGTLLMQEDPSIGVDLPLKVLIFQDHSGKTRIAYKDGSYYEEHYHIVKHKKLLHKISNVLNNLTNKASQCKRD